MDRFKQIQMSHIGVGGMGCPCCNIFRGKKIKRNKRILNKIARKSLKRELRNLQSEGSA
jgi:hypothetical protein